MGKAVKILLTLAMLMGIASLVLGILSARDEGLTVLEVGEILKDNLEELNISPVYREYSDIREVIHIAADDSTDIVITNTFPDLELQSGEDMAVELAGDVSSQLDQLVSWQKDGDTLFIDFASVFNENPTSTGLQAVLILPSDLTSLKITSISGDVAVSGITSRRMDLEVKSGNIQLLDAEAGSLRAVSRSGNIQVSGGVLPDVTLRTVSGSIHVEAQGVGGTIQSVSGTLSAWIQSLTGDLAMTTESGSIAVTHSGQDYDYELKSGSGTVSAIDPEVVTRYFTGSNGEPGYLLQAVTASGDVIFQTEP